MNIEILLSKNDKKVIKVNNIYLCSKYDPIREANVLINSYKHILNEKIIHVIGLGAGYHIKELAERIEDNQIVKIYEEKREIYNLLEDEIKKICKNKNIKIYFRDEIGEFIGTLMECKDIIIHKPSMKVMEDRELERVIDRFIVSKDSVNKFSDTMEENEKVNVESNYPGIEQFLCSATDKMKIVASAGPSLDLVIDDIKRNRDKFEIYAVGAAFRTLMEGGITPELIVITDPQKVVEKQLKGYENSKIPLAFLSTASRWAVESYKGPKYIFFNKEYNSNIIIETGKTVAVSAIDLAIKSKAAKIIFVGQDLAYLNNKTHAKSYESIYGVKDEIEINRRTEYVIGVSGERLMTTSSYLIFKDNIEKLINKNKNVKFYNCSMGANIIGTKHSKIEELI